VAAIFGLAGCAINPPPSAPVELTFAQVAPIRLPVRSVDIVMPQVTDIVPSDASLEWPQSPASALEKLLRHQLVADGTGDQVLVVHVDRADVMRRDIPGENAWAGIFATGPSTVYDLTVRVSFSLDQSTPPRLVTARIAGDRQVTVVDGMSPADRDRSFFAATEKLMNEVAVSINDVIKRNVLSAPETGH
jgi:hypothetical protein